jgi:hypothetical protein
MAMASASNFANGNKVLHSLSASDQALLKPDLVPVSLLRRHSIEKPNQRIDDIFFSDNALVSVVALPTRDIEVEIGIIGCEGMTGYAVVAGSDRSPFSVYIQVAGDGQRIGARQLNSAMAQSSTLRSCLAKYAHAFGIQTGHTVVANARAKLGARLARWLLMAHDRLPGNSLDLTHEFLAVMLACRRAGVTEGLHALAAEDLISIGRRHIKILNRKGLERIAGVYYGASEAEYRRLTT